MKVRLLLFKSIAILLVSAPVLCGQQPPRIQSVVVQPDHKVLFRLRAPSASMVSVDGSYPITTKVASKMQDVPMLKDDQGIWSVTVGPLNPDIYEYHFMVDGLRVNDPANVAHLSGDSNWFFIPGSDSDNYVVHDVPHGRVSLDWYASPVFHMVARRLAVYTPPGYQTGSRRYPVLYLLHWGGGDELAVDQMLRLPEIMDNLIAQGKAVPMIVVMPNSNPLQALAPGDATVPGPGESLGPRSDLYSLTPYTESLVGEIIPFIDREYRTQADRDDRAIGGFSLGGTHALLTAFQHLDQFAWLGQFSSGLDALPNLAVKIPPPADAATRRGAPSGQSIDAAKFASLFPVIGPGLSSRLRLLYVSIGDDDGLLEGWQTARKVFDEKGVRYVWRELPHYGHDGSTWRVILQDFLPRLFQPAK